MSSDHICHPTRYGTAIINTSNKITPRIDFPTALIPATGTSVEARSTAKPQYVAEMEMITPKSKLFISEVRIALIVSALNMP